MTKDAYLSMCEALGSEPKEEEIPVAVEDLLFDTVRAIAIHSYLPDRFEGMSGFPYKDLAGLNTVLKAFSIESPEDILYIMSVLKQLDADNVEEFNNRSKNVKLEKNSG